MTRQRSAFEQLQIIERDNKDARATRVEIAVIRGAILEMIMMGKTIKQLKADKATPKKPEA